MNLEYNDKDHTYKIGGVYVPGCTTVTGIMPKPWLAPWAAKETVLRLSEILLPGRSYAADEIQAILTDAKGAHARKRDKAADKGTAAHEYFEKFVKAKIAGQIITLPIPEDPDVANSVQLFLQWEATSGIKWLHSEVIVGSERYMFGGKFDAVGLLNGRKVLIDFKTSSDLYYEAHVQTAGYQLACEEMGIAVEDRLLLWVPKTGRKFKGHLVETPYALDKKCFLAALDIYHCLQDCDKIKKEAKKAVVAA